MWVGGGGGGGVKLTISLLDLLIGQNYLFLFWIETETDNKLHRLKISLKKCKNLLDFAASLSCSEPPQRALNQATTQWNCISIYRSKIKTNVHFFLVYLWLHGICDTHFCALCPRWLVIFLYCDKRMDKTYKTCCIFLFCLFIILSIFQLTGPVNTHSLVRAWDMYQCL